MSMESVTDDDSSDLILLRGLKPTTQSNPRPSLDLLTDLFREINLEEPHPVDLGLNTNHDKTQTQDYTLTTASSDTVTSLFDSQEESEDYQTDKTRLSN